jgi:hypothetical protein
VEAACAWALEIGARTYGSVRSILDNHLDHRTVPQRATDSPELEHRDIVARVIIIEETTSDGHPSHL